MAYYLVRWRRKLVDANLARAFPDLAEAERRAIGREHIRHVIDTSLESLKGGTIAPQELMNRVHIQNIEVLEDYYEQPFFLVGGHQGNWEWQLLALSNALVTPLEAVYAPIANPALEANLIENRSRFGMKLIPRADTMKEIAKRLKEPRAIVLLADQNPRRDVERHWLRFLNQDTAFAVGIDKLARLTRYPVIFLDCKRTRRGYYNVTLVPLATPPYPKERAVVLERYAQHLEESIMANPSDWLWSYDRWRYPKPLYG